MTRWAVFEGLDNVRDAGGLPLNGGGTTRPGVLLRSASLHYTTPADVRRLVEEVRVRVVLDLRTPREIDGDGPTAVAAAGVETVALNLIGESREWLPRTGDDTDPLLRIYRGYLTDFPERVVEAARRVAEVRDGAALVHCAAGKDRTGVVTAMMLDAVGVERDAVVADYAASSEQIEAMFRRWTTAAGEPMPPAEELLRHHPRAPVMDTLLSEVDAGHGGAAGWLTAHGLSEESLTRLRERLTTPP